MPLAFTCPSGSESLVAGSGVEYPACATGQGEWIEYTAQFSLLGYPIEEESFGDLLNLMLLLMAVAYTIKIVRRVLENRR